MNPTEVFSAVKSKHLLDKFLTEKFGMIFPEKIKVGMSHRWRRKETAPFVDLVEVEDIAYLIPFLESLKNLLNNDEIREMVENPRISEDGVLRTVLDGEYYRNNEFFKNNKNSLAIILYADELGIANPLGANSKKEKLYMLYWTLGNIHPEFRSHEDVVQLLGIVKSTVVKKHGLTTVLKPVVEKINVLVNEGISINVNNQEKTFKGSVLFSSEDTPAAAEMGGFKMSVSAYRPCRTCFTTDSEWRLKFDEKYFVLRNAVTHADHLRAVTEPNLSKSLLKFLKTKYGVNGLSALKDIVNFDVTKCFPQDAMHVLIEGAVDVEIRALLRFLIDLNLFTVDDLNDRISNFDFNYFGVNKPALIAAEHIQKDKSLKQSASQMFGLAHCLPFLVAEWTHQDKREEVTERIKCHIRLLQILNVCLSFEIHLETVDLLTRMIEIFVTQFDKLYPNTIVPKFHFLIHVPSCIKLFGPARQQWCFRFEAAHNYYKSLVHVVRNFKNMPYTLSYRHQARLCSRLASASEDKSKKFLYQGHEISAGTTVLLQNLANACLLQNYVPDINQMDLKIMRTPRVEFHGTTYKNKDIILVETDDELLPLFGVILEMFVVGEKIILMYNALDTQVYSKDFNAYVIEKPEIPKQHSILIDHLIFPHPLPVFKFQGVEYVLLLNNERTEFYG